MSYNFVPYLSWDSSQLLRRLAEVSSEIAGLLDEIAMAESQALQEKNAAYHHSIAETHAQREREADAAAFTFTDSLISMKGQRDALIEEKFFLIRLLDRSDREPR